MDNFDRDFIPVAMIFTILFGTMLVIFSIVYTSYEAITNNSDTAVNVSVNISEEQVDNESDPEEPDPISLGLASYLSFVSSVLVYYFIVKWGSKRNKSKEEPPKEEGKLGGERDG